MLEQLKDDVCNANIELSKSGLVIYTWGNVSGIDRDSNYMVIKPSGVDYSKMTAKDMVVVDINTGDVIEGTLRPSSDTLTHMHIYRNFPDIGGITHTHSINAVAFAQAGMDIKVLGTTHADYFAGDVICTKVMSDEEINCDYELNTGKIIVDTIKERQIDPTKIPAILVRNHGPFTFGGNALESVRNSVILETVADMNYRTLLLNRDSNIKKTLADKHFNRKHGSNAYYGQQ